MMQHRIFARIVPAIVTALVLPGLAAAEGATLTYEVDAAGEHRGAAHAGTDGVWCGGGGAVGARQYFYVCEPVPVPPVPRRSVAIHLL
ncbi:MAG: hypothetical protein ACT4PT_09905 [Methanobacteriota archaeon]